jgi:hypothetical protein
MARATQRRGSRESASRVSPLQIRKKRGLESKMAITARTACHSIASAWQSATPHSRSQTNSVGSKPVFRFVLCWTWVLLRHSTVDWPLSAPRQGESISNNSCRKTNVAFVATSDIGSAGLRWGQGYSVVPATQDPLPADATKLRVVSTRVETRHGLVGLRVLR